MTFTKAVELVLKHEGGMVNNSHDPGGLTNFGISKRAYPDVDIRNLTRKQAIEIYRHDYWEKLNADYLDNSVATVLFDMAVNLGVTQASKLLQKAVNVEPDGLIGPETIAASKRFNGRIIAERLTQERIMFYASLKTFPVFGKGWVARSINTAIEAL